jgi:hypothetical protein
MTELSLHILDIVHNSISAKASVVAISVYESKMQNKLEIEISDNGKGMDISTLDKVTDPFYTTRTTRKVGLGIPLFKQAVEICEGNFNIDSVLGKGTIIKAALPLAHIDRQPMGDIAGVLVQLVSSFPYIDFVYKHITDKGEYIFNTKEIKEMLEGMSLQEPEIIKFIREMIRENLNVIEMIN